MSSDALIQVAGLSKAFSFSHNGGWSLLGRSAGAARGQAHGKDQYWALDGVSFEVRRGETIGVLGRNGAGKSTLLQLITGVLAPTQGIVAVRGRIGALLELGAGFNHELTGRENVLLSGAVLGMSHAETSTKMADIEAFADIGEFMDHPVKTYSSGMLVRLAFSVQVHMEPDILIVDEALSVGDMFFQQKCLSKIKEIIDAGVTLFFVSHSINAVKSICQRAILLEKGRIVADGNAQEVCEIYQNAMSSVSALDLQQALLTNQDATASQQFLDVQVAHGVTHLEQPDFATRLTNRSGGGEVRFTGFACMDETGTIAQALTRADKVRLILQLHAHADVPPGACLGVLVRDAHGVDIVAFNSNFYGKYLPALQKGRSYVYELRIDFPYARGRYSFHCGLKPAADSPYFYDRCFNVGVLDVESNPLTWGEYGGRVIQAPQAISLYGA